MNINNPSMQDLEDAMKEKFEKEDAYWKALEKHKKKHTTKQWRHKYDRRRNC